MYFVLFCFVFFFHTVPNYLRKMWDEEAHKERLREQAAAHRKKVLSPTHQGVTAIPLTPGQQATVGYVQEPAVTPASQVVTSQPVNRNVTSEQQSVEQESVTQPNYSNVSLPQQPEQQNAQIASQAEPVPPAQTVQPVQPTQPEQAAYPAQQVYSNASEGRQPVQPVTVVPEPVYSNASFPEQPVQQPAQPAQQVYSNATVAQQPTQPVYSNASLPQQPVQPVQLAQPAQAFYSNNTVGQEPVYSNATPSLQPVEQGWSNVTSAQQSGYAVPEAQQPVYANASVSPQTPAIEYDNVSAPGMVYPGESSPLASQGLISNVSAPYTPPQSNQTIIPPAGQEAIPGPAQVGSAAEANASIPQAQAPTFQPQSTVAVAPAHVQNETAGQTMPSAAVATGTPAPALATAAQQPAPAQANNTLQSPEVGIQGRKPFLETLRLRFGHFTSGDKLRFAVNGFTLPVCPYLGLKIRGW